MSSKLVSSVLGKLDEYGISVYSDFEVEKGTHIITTEGMTIHINLEEKHLAVSFHAATKPEVSANISLILNEIAGIEQFDIMESFAYGANRKIVSGDEAFELIEDIIEGQVISNYLKDQSYKHLLLSNDCYKC